MSANLLHPWQNDERYESLASQMSACGVVGSNLKRRLQHDEKDGEYNAQETGKRALVHCRRRSYDGDTIVSPTRCGWWLEAA